MQDVRCARMTYLWAILIILSALCAGCAILYQRSDHVTGYGSTMGGEMTAGLLWSLSAVIGGIGTGMILKWYWGIAVFLAVYLLGFKIRRLVESILLRAH